VQCGLSLSGALRIFGFVFAKLAGCVELLSVKKHFQSEEAKNSPTHFHAVHKFIRLEVWASRGIKAVLESVNGRVAQTSVRFEQDHNSSAKYLWTKMSKQGYRLYEPVEISAEEPTVLSDIIDIHRMHHGYSVVDWLTWLALSRTSSAIHFSLR